MDELAEVLAAKRMNLTFLFGPKYLAPIRYFILFFRTYFVLLRERPDVVYAQNPSIFLPLTCLPYCKLFGKKLIIDHHAVWSTKTLSKGVLSSIISRLEKFASSHANANTTPHRMWTGELISMGANNVVTVYDYVGKAKTERNEKIRAEYSLGKEFLILAPHGGHMLEMVESEVTAAASIGRLMLLISGPEAKIKTRISNIHFPENAKYIGFLGRSQYELLEASVDIGLSITEEPYTISHSLLEFAANTVPIVSSKQEAVEELFGDSILYVKSSQPNDVRSALWDLISNPNLLKFYKEKLRRKYEELKSEREKSIEELRKLVFGP